MRGIASWLGRDLTYTVTDPDDPGFEEVYTVFGPPNLAPDWAPGGPSSYRGGMGIPGAWRAATMRAEQLARFPWHLFRDRERQTARRLPTPQFLIQPSPPFTRFTTLASMALDLVWHGNSISVITGRNADLTPRSLMPIGAENVGVRVNPRNGRVEYDIGGKVFDHVDVLHILGSSAPGQLRGLGVIEAHFDGLNLSKDLHRAAVKAHAHGVPTGVIEATAPDVTPGELKASKDSWLKAQRDRTIAATAPGTKFTPISWNPEQLQLVEARKFDLTQLALMFGIPGYWLGAEATGFTYSNAEWEGSNLLKYTAVGADVERFEQAFSLLYPRGQFVKANLDAVLRSSTRERYEAHQIGIDAGFLLDSEARAIEDLPPLPEIPAQAPEVAAALDLAKSAPTLVQIPGLPALVDQLRALSGKPPLAEDVNAATEQTPAVGGDDDV